jgi:Lecithin retinol acyltransferase
MKFLCVEFSVLKICKMPIQNLSSFADHYYLSETTGLDNSLGWGVSGIELQGVVRVTQLEIERINKFISAAKYNIVINNCEHFANYVLHGINLSSQQHTCWKCLSADIISLLQPAQSIIENYNSFVGQQIAELLNENLRQAKIDEVNQHRVEFWERRTIDSNLD